MSLSPADETWLAGRGIAAGEAKRQLELLTRGATPPRLTRAARLGDGIAPLSQAQRDRWSRQFRAHAGDVGFFVPASGAASRMFAGLKALLETPETLEQDAKVRALLACPAVAQSLEPSAPADTTSAVRTLLSPRPEGLDWPGLPKAFLPFHLDASGKAQTAIEAQMQESCALLGPDGQGTLHCSLSPEHLERETRIREQAAAFAGAAGCRLGFMATEQDPSTDTLAVDGNGNIVRNGQGNPLLRAGGHGSLLKNLARTPGQVVLVKNIDNIQPHGRQELVLPWRQALAGIALELRRQGDALLASAPGSDEEKEKANGFASLLADLARPESLDIAALRALADRPVRACGMVKNDGAPGGGPFWVEGKGLQIVEQSEVSNDPAQQELLKDSTHFNPVEMACCLHRPDGSRHDLEAFRDPSRAFLACKPGPKGGTLTVLEHPGLWNGSMGKWLTVFVEIPPDTFLPAKTVFDLAHPWRQKPLRESM